MEKSFFYLMIVTIVLSSTFTSCKKDEVSVTNVTLDQTIAVIAPGKTMILTATVTPDDATNQFQAWESSNPGVATVADGVVTAVSDGTVQITVTMENGTKTATCDVTVTSKQITLTTQASNKVVFIAIELAGTGAMSIDWGDETENEVSTLSSKSLDFTHSYSGYEGYISHNITIIGENITHLDCRYNQLTKLDVSKTPTLKELKCYENQLTSLDVKNNKALTLLWCHLNQLTSLDVSDHTELTFLSCRENEITNLNVTGCTALKTFYCFNNDLTSLDVNNLTNLQELKCSYNDIGNLNLEGCKALEILECERNRLATLNLNNCLSLRELNCNINRLTNIAVIDNTKLTSLSCEYNQITGLDVSNNTALITLLCQSNRLTNTGLDAMFGTLHNNPISGKTVFVGGNIGASTCDPNIAISKGWTVISN